MMVQANNDRSEAAAEPLLAAECGDSSGCCSSSKLAGLLSPQLFKALSDPKRLSLLLRLAEQREPRTVGQIAEGSGVDLSVVSRHLAILRGAGVISCEKQGKEVWCTVRTGAVARVLRELADALEACCPEGCRSVLDREAATPATGAASVPPA